MSARHEVCWSCCESFDYGTGKCPKCGMELDWDCSASNAFDCAEAKYKPQIELLERRLAEKDAEILRLRADNDALKQRPSMTEEEFEQCFYDDDYNIKNVFYRKIEKLHDCAVGRV